MRTLTVEVYSCCAPRLFLCCSGRPASEHPPGSLGSRSQQGGERGGLFVGEVKVHRRDMGLRSAPLPPAPRLPPPPAPAASEPVLQIEPLRPPAPAKPDDEGLRRQQRGVVAGLARHLQEVTSPEIPDPRQIKGQHPRASCSCIVLSEPTS